MPSASASNMKDKSRGAIFKSTNFSEPLALNLAKQSSAELSS